MTERQDALHLLELRRTTESLAARNAQHAREHTLTGPDVDEWLTACDNLATAAECFRRRYYPNRGRVVVALGVVSTSGRTGRRGRIILAHCYAPITTVDGDACCDRGHSQEGGPRCSTVTADHTRPAA